MILENSVGSGKQIIEQKADYVLSLKGNQGELHDDVVTYFESDLSQK